MRHILSLSLILLFSISTFAQEQLDSVYIYNWLDEAWNVNRKLKQTYPEPNLIVRNQTKVDVDGTETPQFYFEYYYDDQGNQTGFERSDWDVDIQDWQKATKVEYTYDNLNRQTSRLVYAFDPSSESFYQTLRNEYKEYDDFNNYAKYLKYEIDSIGGWYLDYGINYYRFYENMLLDSMSSYDYSWELPDTVLLNAAKYYYNSEDLIETEDQYSPNDIDELLRTYRRNYTHENGLLAKELRYADINGQLELFDENNFFYTQYGNQNDRIKGHYEGSELVNDWRISATFLISSSTTPQFIEGLNLICSNPNLNTLSIRLTNENDAKDYRLTIYNLNGQVSKHITLKKVKEWQQEYVLLPGTYVVHIQDNKGHTLTKKAVVH